MPKQVKYKKWQRGKMRGIEVRATQLAFGAFGLKSLGTSWVTVRQIEAARRTILRFLKKGGKLWIRIFPDKPVTSKGTEFAMGGGKGPVSHYVFSVRPGRIIFELDGVKEEIAREAFKIAADKLPVKTKFIKKIINLTMELKDLRQKTKPDLEKQLSDLRTKLRQLKFDLVAGKLKNVREIRENKKNIAQVLTILKEK